MSEYPAGTVAVATVRGVKGVRVFRRYLAEGVQDWAYETTERGVDYSCGPDHDLTDVRPLVVLDLADAPYGGTVNVTATLRKYPAETCRWLADQIEAQTKPPRIPEPGLWGVVEASCRCDSERVQWVLHGSRWMDRNGDFHDWDDLIDPVLIREGVES